MPAPSKRRDTALAVGRRTARAATSVWLPTRTSAQPRSDAHARNRRPGSSTQAGGHVTAPGHSSSVLDSSSCHVPSSRTRCSIDRKSRVSSFTIVSDPSGAPPGSYTTVESTRHTCTSALVAGGPSSNDIDHVDRRRRASVGPHEPAIPRHAASADRPRGSRQRRRPRRSMLSAIASSLPGASRSMYGVHARPPGSRGRVGRRGLLRRRRGRGWWSSRRVAGRAGRLPGHSATNSTVSTFHRPCSTTIA